MKKTIVFVLLLVLVGFALGSCNHEAVFYCPFCGKSDIQEISLYDPDTGLTTIYYKCLNPKCGKRFGVGQKFEEE